MNTRKHIGPIVAAALVALLFGAAPIGNALNAPDAPASVTQAITAAAPAASLIGDLLGLAGLDGSSLGLDHAALDALIAGDSPSSGLSPSGVVDMGRGILESLDAAETPSAAFAAAAGIGIPAPVPTPPGPASLTEELLGLYARHGATLGPLDVLGLKNSVASLDPALAGGLGILVAAANDALDATLGGDVGQIAQAAADQLAAIEAAQPMLLSPPSASSGPGLWLQSPPSTDSNEDCPTFDPNQPHGPNNPPPIFQDPLGFVSLRGTCDDFDTVHHVLQVDLGGNDRYENRAGGSGSTNFDLTPNTSGLAVSIDLRNGNDVYDDTVEFTQGASLGGIGILFDEAGNDVYEAGRAAQGMASSGGIGVLVDRTGTDIYTGGRLVQGSNDGGFLLDLGSEGDSYTAGSGSQGGRLVPLVSLLPSVLYDRSGNDRYNGTGIVQGAANFLVDGSGNDDYDAVGTPFTAPDNGFAQGVGFGTATGMIIDGSGDDHYTSNIAVSQAFSVGAGVGALLDFGGADHYTAALTAQSVCTSTNGVGTVLFDGSGDDHYNAGNGQGSSRSSCGAFLVDRSGDDHYTAGDHSQGNARSLLAALSGQPLAGVLLDGSGNDDYNAGSNSQGSGTGIGFGTGLLVDADGTDTYDAGDASQGSGNGANGILTDGVPGGLFGDNPPSGPGPKADHYTAGGFSQGSGSAGGVGVLVDNDDETTGNGGPNRATYDAGDFSQGAERDGSFGVLVDREGGDDYSAGTGSQGAGTNGNVGLLADVSGKDTYTTTDADHSQGYGDSTEEHLALGLLLDTNHDNDEYQGVAADNNNECRLKGYVGVTADFNAPFLPPDCIGVAIDAALRLVTVAVPFLEHQIDEILAQVLPPPLCDNSEAFCDDMESGDGKWTKTSTGANEWQLIDSDDQPTAGPNAKSGTHYWYVGSTIYPGVTYFGNPGLLAPDTPEGGVAVLTSTAFTVPAGGVLTFSVAGGAEPDPCCDDMEMEVLGTTVSDTFDVVGPYTTFSYDLSVFAGTSVQIRFTFAPDANLEAGPGFSVDDVRVV